MENSNIQNILQTLKDINTQSSFNVFIPSLKKDVKFRQLNIKQLKELLGCVIDSPIFTTEFTLTFNNIIKENCIESIDTNKLTILDKLSIFIKTRIESITPIYTFQFTQDEIAEYNLSATTYDIDLNTIYNTFISNWNDLSPQVITHNSIEVICSIPTLETENRLEEEINKNVKLQISTPEELRTSLSNLFINEISKFVQTIKINDTNIDLDTLTYQSRLDLIETLPVSIVSDILKYIESYKIKANVLTVHTFEIDGIEMVKEISQDPTFFSI